MHEMERPTTFADAQYSYGAAPAPASDYARCSVPGNAPCVPREIARANEASAVNAKMIGELKAKPSCLVAPLPPAAGRTDTGIEPALCPLAAEIRGIADRLHQSNAALGMLMSRLEI